MPSSRSQVPVSRNTWRPHQERGKRTCPLSSTTFYLESKTKSSHLHLKPSGSKGLYKPTDSMGKTDLRQKRPSISPVSQAQLLGYKRATVCSCKCQDTQQKISLLTPTRVLWTSVATSAALNRSILKPNLILREQCLLSPYFTSEAKQEKEQNHISCKAHLC